MRRAKRARPGSVIASDKNTTWRSWLHALRPHHWAKNALMFLPALAAHLSLSLDLGLRLVAGLAAFSAMASASYLFNDLTDLSSDRRHATKRYRPLAAGDIPIRHALVVAPALAVLSAAVAWSLSPAFAAVLAAYLVITSAYSVALKHRLIVDVITLATLYTVRVVAGAVLVEVQLSRWFLAFTIFLFLSLALAKRALELRELMASGAEALPGRSYRPDDLPALGGMGAAAAAASALVYCLYITSDDVRVLYNNPDLLWIGLPLFLYWITRLWVLEGRGALREDLVAFALRDRVTYAVFAAFLLTVWLAA